MMTFIEHIKDFAGLIYPQTCISCNSVLQYNEDVVCTFCLYDLPETNFHLQKENKLSEFFWGRVKIEAATALFYYEKGSKIQEFMHKFKYKGKYEAGIYAGNLLANKLKTSTFWENPQIVIPVPLHPKKKKQRGYNQSEYFAYGLSQGLDINLSVNNLIRKSYTESQTRKSRFMRWKNVETVYQIKNPNVLKNKNLLLVDDVITTGSTIEACTQKLLNIEGTKVWVAALAMSS